MENTDTIILPELSMFFSTLHSQSGNGRSALIPCLHAAQDLYGFIPDEVIRDISQNLEITIDDINEVLDFYTLFHRSPTNKTVLHVCNDSVCKMAGADTVFKSIRNNTKVGIHLGQIDLEKTPCLGMCAHTPSVRIQGNLLRFPVKTDLRLQPAQSIIHSKTNILGENRQITRNCGKNRSCSLMEYWSKDGYQALKNTLSRPRDSIIEEIEASGLTGRGGDSFLTGIKWEKVATSSQKARFVVCNASEADPTNFKDRVLLEEDPHSVLEGMIIAGYALQATQGYICINGEYDLANHIFSNALVDARQAGLLGNNIMGTKFNFDIELRRCAGRYISGEETALLEFIEGKCAIPRGKPPFPTSKGLFGKPTIINNTETFCNIPLLLRMGSLEYRKIGTETSKGTILISLTGDLNNPGLVEIPFGMTFRQVIYDLCGGISDGHAFQTALVGGVTGTFITDKQLDTRISLDTLRKAGLSLGGGSIVTLSDTRNIKDVLAIISQFFLDETCGNCPACLSGTKIQMNLIKKAKIENFSSEDMKLFRNSRRIMETMSKCQMGKLATNALESAFANWPARFF